MNDRKTSPTQGLDRCGQATSGHWSCQGFVSPDVAQSTTLPVPFVRSLRLKFHWEDSFTLQLFRFVPKTFICWGVRRVARVPVYHHLPAGFYVAGDGGETRYLPVISRVEGP
ncbi:hypothetical protein E2C01_026447 [Portunus trituberculatus]|uniref:Uncharacterized protein n=1 Tax=Portunus trituberculatus TaxID=210409 RepID=A0A5B7EI65_PORTR|nr:hypothetical protein [Portunus trituberculatus]